MRIWFKEWLNNRMIQDTVVEDYSEDTRTHKVLKALGTACQELDLSVPIWLESNTNEFKRSAKTRFRQDSFIEELDFTYLEMQVIEEDF
ncbi:MAG: hypothetical protein K5989_02760 [Lachnospiraceae bacterium]|nr:hypothetical protein [Lachnospiraceae bacterium]